jgi:ABC-2 type transport system ATP-binding protein
MHCIEIDNVTKTYSGKTAVEQLTLNVPKGCIYGFIGPNGSGKTTTLRMILSIIHPDAGTIRIFGEASHGQFRKRIGYLPEERGLYKKMKVTELIRFFAQLKGKAVSTAEVQSWLDRLDLSSCSQHKVESLSKGMSQKVQFICTAIGKPELLILDEPFSGLDPVNAETLRQCILELREQGTTIVFSTHDMSTAERMCERVFMIYKGRKVLDGTLGEIRQQFGSDTLRIRTSGATPQWKQLPEVENLLDFGQEQELRLRADCDPQSLLKRIVSMPDLRLERFEITHPSLHDIFVRIAAPQASDLPTNS